MTFLKLFFSFTNKIKIIYLFSNDTTKKYTCLYFITQTIFFYQVLKKIYLRNTITIKPISQWIKTNTLNIIIIKNDQIS